jgi:hypothetical protein
MEKSLKQQAEEDKDFVALYEKCGLPNKQHEKLSKRRQYSKFLKRRGIVWQSK